MFKNTVGCAWRKLVAWSPRDGDQSTLRGMLELPMAAARAIEIPTVRFNQLDCGPDFHGQSAASIRDPRIPLSTIDYRLSTPKAFGVNCSRLLLIGGNLWQRRRQQAFLFFLIQRQTCRRDNRLISGSGDCPNRQGGSGEPPLPYLGRIRLTIQRLNCLTPAKRYFL